MQAVRSTQRIMAAAESFARVKQGTVSHAAEGPPLRTYLFTPKGGEEARMEEYAIVVADKAVHNLIENFPGLSWNNRLMIVVRDGDFRR